MFFYGSSLYEDGKKTKCIYNTIPVEGFYKKKEVLESMTTSHFVAVNPRGATRIISVTRLDHEETFPRIGGYLGQNHSIPTIKFSTPPVLLNSAVQFHMKMKQIYFNWLKQN